MYFKKDPKQSSWYIDYILDERKEYCDPRHRNYKKFTNRFVVDQPGVIEICNTIKNLPEDKQFWTDKCNKSTPLELLVLGVLRTLTRNWTFDCISESTNVSQEVHRVFFPKFVKWYAIEIAPLTIYMPDPTDHNAVKSNGLEYEAAGFPLCLGSVDCVHIRQWLCSRNLKQYSTGKEKYPSRVYEAIVNHRKLFLNVTRGFMGATNDKTIVKFDKAVTGLRDGKYGNHSCDVYDKNGNTVEMKGCYLINDNGYQKWSTLMEPSKNSITNEELEWSEMLESLRKDIECAFGILKQLFAILKYGARVTSMETMDHIFLTCCSIYNQRMRQLGKDEPWQNILDHSDETEEEVGFFKRMVEMHKNVPEAEVGLPLDVELDIDDNSDENVEVGPSHDVRKQMLINHFSYCAQNKMIKWPRENKKWHTYNPNKRDV